MDKPFDPNPSVPLADDLPIALRVETNPDAPNIPEASDFIPNPVQKPSPNTRKEDKFPKVFLENTEFRSFADQKKIEKKRNKRTLALAKQLFNAKRDENEIFATALKIVRSATDEQRANPTKQLTAAMIAVEKGRPITKKVALDRAKKEVLNQERVPELISEDEGKDV